MTMCCNYTFLCKNTFYTTYIYKLNIVNCIALDQWFQLVLLQILTKLYIKLLHILFQSVLVFFIKKNKKLHLTTFYNHYTTYHLRHHHNRSTNILPKNAVQVGCPVTLRKSSLSNNSHKPHRLSFIPIPHRHFQSLLPYRPSFILSPHTTSFRLTSQTFIQNHMGE